MHPLLMQLHPQSSAPCKMHRQPNHPRCRKRLPIQLRRKLRLLPSRNLPSLYLRLKVQHRRLIHLHRFARNRPFSKQSGAVQSRKLPIRLALRHNCHLAAVR